MTGCVNRQSSIVNRKEQAAYGVPLLSDHVTGQVSFSAERCGPTGFYDSRFPIPDSRCGAKA